MPNTSKKPEETVVLVTVAAGMVGSHLIDELLKRGYVLIGIDDLSVGTGLRISAFQVDYAFVGHDDLGNTHRISTSIRF